MNTLSSFTTIDKQTVAGRGVAHVVIKPAGVPLPAKGEQIKLDGEIVTVHLLECQSMSASTTTQRKMRLGLFVRDANKIKGEPKK